MKNKKFRILISLVLCLAIILSSFSNCFASATLTMATVAKLFLLAMGALGITYTLNNVANTVASSPILQKLQEYNLGHNLTLEDYESASGITQTMTTYTVNTAPDSIFHGFVQFLTGGETGSTDLHASGATYTFNRATLPSSVVFPSANVYFNNGIACCTRQDAVYGDTDNRQLQIGLKGLIAGHTYRLEISDGGVGLVLPLGDSSGWNLYCDSGYLIPDNVGTASRIFVYDNSARFNIYSGTYKSGGLILDFSKFHYYDMTGDAPVLQGSVTIDNTVFDTAVSSVSIPVDETDDYQPLIDGVIAGSIPGSITVHYPTGGEVVPDDPTTGGGSSVINIPILGNIVQLLQKLWELVRTIIAWLTEFFNRIGGAIATAIATWYNNSPLKISIDKIIEFFTDLLDLLKGFELGTFATALLSFVSGYTLFQSLLTRYLPAQIATVLWSAWLVLIAFWIFRMLLNR